MNEYDIKDTIAALATAYSKSALAVIRMSGSKALQIASKICFYANNENKNIENFEHRKSYYALIKDENNIPIDELIVLSTLAPNTFTSEDTIEFISHGSIIVIDSLMKLIIKNGARSANKGEFTYRAYINGRIGISEAEAIHDLIDSSNKLMAEASIYKMRGRLTREIDKLRENIKNSLMIVYGELDFPEDDTESFSYNKLIEIFIQIKNDIENILSNSKRVESLINGIKVAILGKVNAGKSSIFNMILENERAIVSNIAGTTRDFLSESIYIENIPFYFMDTAGFHKKADNDIELEGIERAKKCAYESDIILAVFDNSCNANDDDINLIEFLNTLNNKNIIYIINKNDEDKKFNYKIESGNIISISTKTKEGRETLMQALKNHTSDSDIYIFNKESYVNNREKSFLEMGLKQIDICIEKSISSFSLDEIAEEMNILNNIIGNVSGKIDAEEVINEIFANFCIGK
ncbi:tRNA uridine-5-carboxymethylaminomethyl(34) synthesis GTPase MnmE [uncultured Brachyspira sp.]|uniref:tRNA uridine-5-carboxymethylaminomethyl(34) synthesis GTPase MnmE n=1 Tax=uncultured Brachyspira sp. TaxID=221953 RepID=UPI0026186A39|nr:tRNA uridine-5-carboxymethylaminomethyl(34) synthesis GTPase MnmE [uncultured Brachyspira sp.]